MNLAFLLAPAFLAYQSAVLDVPKDLLKPVPAANATLAKVNGVEIRTSDVDALLWEWRRKDVLADIITYQIVKDAAKKLEVQVTDVEVQGEAKKLVDGIVQTLPPGQTIEQAMEEEGTAPSRIFIRVKTEMLLRKMILKDFVPGDYVKISTIVFKPTSASTEDTQVALDKAQRAYNRLVGGESWDEVLLSVTDDARARAALGAVGWRPKRLFPEATQTELAALKKGGYTKPSATANGIQIFRLDVLGGTATAVERQELEESYVAGQRQNFMTKLRGEARVEGL